MKNVLITGGTSKIGLRLIKYFIKKKYFIICHYNNNYQKIDYPYIDFFKLDFSNIDIVKKNINKIFKKYEHIDLIINNACLFVTDDHKLSNLMENVNYKSPELINNLYYQSYDKGKIINFTDTRI
jgi:short-subunit dehydrogenase involved in D-alanine esterification of teichoic acids